jgi:hypothetical protein
MGKIALGREDVQAGIELTGKERARRLRKKEHG